MSERTLKFQVGDEVIYLGHYGIHDMAGGTDKFIGKKFRIDLASIGEGMWDYVLDGAFGAMDDEVTDANAYKRYQHLRGLYE